MKAYIDIITDLSKKAKNDLKKIKVDDKAVFGKAMGNVRKHRDIKLVPTERRNSKPNCHTTKFFTENLLATKMKKSQILMNKPFFLQLSVLELSKLLIYEF